MFKKTMNFLLTEDNQNAVVEESYISWNDFHWSCQFKSLYKHLQRLTIKDIWNCEKLWAYICSQITKVPIDRVGAKMNPIQNAQIYFNRPYSEKLFYALFQFFYFQKFHLSGFISLYLFGHMQFSIMVCKLGCLRPEVHFDMKMSKNLRSATMVMAPEHDQDIFYMSS